MNTLRNIKKNIIKRSTINFYDGGFKFKIECLGFTHSICLGNGNLYASEFLTTGKIDKMIRNLLVDGLINDNDFLTQFKKVLNRERNLNSLKII